MSADTAGPGPRGTLYELRVTGCLPEHWASWFDCGRIEQLPTGETALFVRVPDQPALHGVLRAIANLGLPLVLLQRLDGPTGDNG